MALGALFNPLNSSMIAVALAGIEAEFQVGVAAVTWLAAGFYLTAVLAPPLMGTLADRFGPRTVFCAGLTVIALTGALAAAAPSFPVLVALRLLQAFGSCATFPSGMAIIQAVIPGADGRPPPRIIAMISMVLTASAAAGPVAAGVLVSLWGWRAVFLVNVPLAVLALVLGLRWLPAVRVASERRAWLPRPRPALLATCGLYALVNVVFYLAFFVVPLWAQRSAGLPALAAGLLVLPMAGLAIVMMPVAVRLVARAGMRTVLVISAVLLIAASCAMFGTGGTGGPGGTGGTGGPGGTSGPGGAGGPGGAVGVVLVVTSLLGLATAFSQFGLNSLVYVHADRRDTGVASGLFQASRFVGAAAAAAATGVLFDPASMAAGGWAMLLASSFVLVGALVLPVKTSDKNLRHKP
ncbi:MFS transporter [Nonomuraea lactucae]|uniref:MFS transporter n=1 Tax=Nonomuraea lactucae TaxID=2249762 RepID=UPI0013B3FB8C|nr:MFS transporter [Nonomuraea lactucae]